MKTIVSERGQITLPKSIRTDLGIRAGTVLELTVVDGKIIGSKREGQDPVGKWKGRGALPRGVASVDDYLSATRA
jgi:AbrB family looped-hinge helix DNA binding protein